jgi:hypothetical protein
MGTETIQIVVAESGTPEAAAGIRSIGESAATSDVALTELLARSGTTSAVMQSLTAASGTAGAALTEMATGATGATAALVATSNEAASAGRGIAAVGVSSTEAAAGMRTATSAGAGLVATFRETAVAAEAMAVAENSVAAATVKSAAAHNATAAAARTHGAGLHHVGEEAEVLKNRLERLEITFIALGLALGVKELIEVTDTYANMSNQLQRIQRSAADFAAKQDDILRIAQASRQPLESVNSLYVNMSMALKNVAGMGPLVSGAVKALAEGAQVSGKSIAETSSALNRLGISLREGSVNGRGFLQFLIQMPEIGERVAVALGYTGANGFKRFVDAANAGRIHTEDFIRALNKVEPTMAAEVGKMEVTIASAFVQMKNAFLDFIGRADHAAGVSEQVAHAIQFLAGHIQAVVGVIAILTVGIGAYGIAVGTAALATAALAFSFGAIIGIIAAAAAAVYFFGNAVKLTSDGSVTAFSLIWGTIKTVVQVLGELYTWLTTTRNGVIALVGALGTASIVLATMFGASILKSIIALAGAFYSLLVPIAAVVAGIAILTAAYLAARFAFVAWTQGMAAAKKDLDASRDAILQIASDIKDKFTVNITDTQGPLAKLKEDLHGVGHEADEADINIVKFGKGAGGQFYDLSQKASAANIEVVSGFGRSSGAVQKLSTDVKAASTSIGSSLGEISGHTKKTGQSFDDLRTQFENDSSGIRNAFGDMIKSTDDWAARSGQYFNKVAGDALNMSNSVTDSMSKMSQARASFAGPHSSGTGATGSMGSNGQEDLQGDWFGARNMANNGASSGISDLSQWYGATGGSYGIADLGWYANGGDFIVGGHGGQDSQLVQFMATPGERVSVETSGQQSAKAGGSSGDYQRPVNVTMNVYAKDANSFRESQSQITLKLANQLRRTASQLGGT